MLFIETAETLDFMRFSSINNNINKLFTLALSGRFWAKIKNFLRNLRKGVDFLCFMCYNLCSTRRKENFVCKV